MSLAICSAAPARLSVKLPDFAKKLWKEAGERAAAIFYSDASSAFSAFFFDIIYLLVFKLKSFSITLPARQHTLHWTEENKLVYI